MSNELEERLDAIFQAVRDFAQDRVAELVRHELALGTDAETVINDALIAAMEEVGDEFAAGRLFVPEMLMAANAMKAGLEVLRPSLAGHAIRPVGKLVIGSVYRDMHDIGKNLVAMIMEGAGFEVVDLGINVLPDDFVAAVRAHRPDLVGLSALLTTTLPSMRQTVEALRLQRRHPRRRRAGQPGVRQRDRRNRLCARRPGGGSACPALDAGGPSGSPWLSAAGRPSQRDGGGRARARCRESARECA